MRQGSIEGLEDTVGRHKDDFYVTPAWVTHAIAPHLKKAGVIVDAGCGTGAIGRALRAVEKPPYAIMYGFESDDDRRLHCKRTPGLYAAELMDWFGECWLDVEPKEVDLIISNPPFRHALRFLELALERVKPGGEVAFLLPAQWDQETNEDAAGRKRERGRFLDRLKQDGREGYGKYAVEGRIDFKGDGRTDRIAYAWFVFGPGHEGVYRRVPTYAPEDVKQLKLGGV